MEIVKVKIDDLKPSEYNPRQIDNDELEKLRVSIKEFGMVEPLVVNKDLTVIGGHQRLKAAKMIGWTEMPCIIVDLDKRREKLLNLALNRITGSWDESKLSNLIREIRDYPDIKLSGLSDQEIEMLSVQYDWKKITNHFKTNKKSELDTEKLLSPCNFYINIKYLGKDKEGNAIYAKLK